MSDYSYVSDEELEMIKRRKMAELLRKAEEERRKREEELAKEAQRQEILRLILTSEARERLSNLRLVRPELARAVEDQLIALAMSGKLDHVITDKELKSILASIYERSRREFRIKIREK